MRLFIQLDENGQPKAWPLIGENVKYLAPPDVCFPAQADAYDEVDLTEFGFETFIEAAQPAHDPLTHKVIEAAPLKVGGQWTRQWQVVALTAPAAAAAIANAKTERVLRIDADADAIRTAVLGGRTTEYQDALADAQAFQAAGFAGPVPAGVQSWLDAKNAVGAGWTAQQAAQDILDTGAAWKTAQQAIRANRLLRKEQVRAAATQAQIDAAMAAWSVFAAAIRAQLGLAA